MPIAEKPAAGRLRFGFACIPIGLPQPVVHSCKLANATPRRLQELLEANLESLSRCVDYCADLGFALFRINSGVVPFGSHPVNTLRWWQRYAGELAELGRRARARGLRLSMHPGQFTVLNSPDPKVVLAAREELVYSARFLDALGMPASGKIVIHLGGVYGDKPAAMARLESAWRALPPEVEARLVLENDERLFGIEDALEMSRRVGAPVVFDRFHHRFYGDALGTPIPELLRRAMKTWRARDGRPKIHFSSQEKGARPGTHDVLLSMPEFKEFLKESDGLELDVMIEARGKENAALEALKAARAARRSS